MTQDQHTHGAVGGEGAEAERSLLPYIRARQVRNVLQWSMHCRVAKLGKLSNGIEETAEGRNDNEQDETK